jgi:hypothetical protein
MLAVVRLMITELYFTINKLKTHSNTTTIYGSTILCFQYASYKCYIDYMLHKLSVLMTGWEMAMSSIFISHE